MKISKISITFMLMACITFRSHTMENTLTKPSPTLIQRLLPSSQGLKIPKILTNLAVMTSILFTSQAMGHLQTNPTTTTLPEIFQTPFPFDQGLSAVAFNPVKKSEIALGGINMISLVDTTIPDKPDSLDLGKDENCTGIVNLIYNPQGTLLAYSTPTSLCIWDLNKEKITHTLPKSVWNPLFNLNGTQVIARGPNHIIIWDLETNELTLAPLNGKETGAVSSLARLFDKNIFVHDNPDGTIVWHLDDPAKTKKVNITQDYLTLFGGNEHQLVSWSKPIPGGHTIELTYGPNKTAIQIEDIINNFAYCPHSNKYFFTTSNPGMDIAMLISALDPDNQTITKLLQLAGDNIYNTPWFSPDGNKVFILAGGANNTLNFFYIDLIKLLNSEGLQTSLP